MTTTDLHTLTGAYAVHALDTEERSAFEHHLAECDACRQEVAEFAATTGRLALASTARTRPAMREQVLQRIRTVRQVPPDTAPPERERREAQRGRGPTWWALAAGVAVAAAFAGSAVWQYERAQDARHEAALAQRHVEDLAGVLTAPDARSRSAKVAGGAGTLVVSVSRDRAVFVASGMTVPPQGQVYQLWFINGGAMRSAGLMDPDRGSQAVLMQGALDDASRVGITVEPAGGSEQPTSTPVAVLSVPV
ncbi:anti-sigma factor domain-containing protein [Streptomyces sp. UH6]|uniref:anti-sigma factor n=1 Tax=Streptomyces sp. UH6 TaxID=2748379 RepID=UPI0015D4B8B0|nr:anti-sigma factor [Streptomyces sp. UH6]NYV73481.1 anti-sigma factor [Streptomyces sp. UH6]